MEGKTSGDLTLLERKAIGTASEKMYQKELKAFMDYAGCRRPEPERGRDRGPLDGAIHESLLSGWPPGLCWGQAHCKLDAPLSGVQQVRGQEDPKSPSMSERVETSVPWPLAGALPPERVVRRVPWHV